MKLRINYYTVTYFLLTFLLFIMSSCNNIRPEDFEKNNTLYLPVITTESIPLNPLESSNEVINFLFEPLLDVNEKGEIMPNLLESWSCSKDGLTWDLRLRKDILWSDGHLMDSGDVIFTLNYLKSPDRYPFSSVNFGFIDSIEKIDEYNLKVKLKDPYGAFTELLHDIHPVPEHIAQKSIEKFSIHPVGNGPFILSGLEPGKFIYLSRNDRYWKKEALPSIKNIVFRNYEDKEKAFQSLLSGEVDLLDSMTCENFIILQEKKKNFYLYDYPGTNYTCIGFNLKDNLFADVRVRQAMSYAIDRELIIHLLLQDLGQFATGPVYPFMTSWYREGKRYDYDPKKGETLMEEAGWHKGDKGFYEKDGRVFYFKLATYKGDPLRERVLTLMSQFFEEIGIAAEPVFMERNEFLQKLYSGELTGWCADLYGGGIEPDNITYSYFYSECTPGRGGTNYGFYSNKEVDKLLLLARKDMNIKSRAGTYYKFQEILSEDVPVIFLYHRRVLVAVSRRMEIPSGAEPVLLKPYGDFYRWKIIR
jgi:peptide/nickel transport system substrate-binding protein